MTVRKLIAIHQPNFFPWLGYFEKIWRSDLFVFLDHVENNPRDSLWTKRVKIIVNQDEYWLTVPLKRPHGSVFVPICEMKISNGDFAKKHLRTIQQSYGKAPFFGQIFPFVSAFYDQVDPHIANRNIGFIDTVCEKLHIATPKLRTCNYRWNGKGTELLIEIVMRFNATSYLCGGGASGYQEDDRFERSGYELVYQNFHHPTYKQFNTKKVIRGLSILDALMNCGFKGTEMLVKGHCL